MRLLLDACVLFPAGVRALLLAHADAGGFTPLWSDRIAEEWARAAERQTGEGAAARIEAALMAARRPGALVTGWQAHADIAGLPDAADAHVIAAAVAGRADGIVSFNTRDFPLRVLGALGLARLHPDDFLRLEYAPGGAIDAALDRIEAPDLRRWLKRAGLPRLGKARAAARA